MDKKIFEDWLKTYPYLKRYGENRLLKILGPIIVGLELIKLPFSEEYRPHFVLYALWGKTLKDCLVGPILLAEIYDEKGNQLSIPYLSGHLNYKIAVNRISAQFYKILNESISLTELLDIMNKYPKASIKKERNSLLTARFLEYQLKVSLYIYDEDRIKELLDKAKGLDWDIDHFKMFDLTPATWIQTLEDQVANRVDLLDRIKINRLDKKLQKLEYSELIN